MPRQRPAGSRRSLCHQLRLSSRSTVSADQSGDDRLGGKMFPGVPRGASLLRVAVPRRLRVRQQELYGRLRFCSGSRPRQSSLHGCGTRLRAGGLADFSGCIGSGLESSTTCCSSCGSIRQRDSSEFCSSSRRSHLSGRPHVSAFRWTLNTSNQHGVLGGRVISGVVQWNASGTTATIDIKFTVDGGNPQSPVDIGSGELLNGIWEVKPPPGNASSSQMPGSLTGELRLIF